MNINEYNNNDINNDNDSNISQNIYNEFNILL
jgi:hypothetical protein